MCNFSNAFHHNLLIKEIPRYFYFFRTTGVYICKKSTTNFNHTLNTIYALIIHEHPNWKIENDRNC